MFPMLIRRSWCAWLVLLVGWPADASAQTTPAPPIRDTVVGLTEALAARPAGEAIALATALEVANAPVGSSAGGFVFKLDPTTGLRVRTAPTFGPSFAERALTAGEGKMSFGVSLSVATYDKLNKLDLDRMQLASATGPRVSETGFASLVMSSETLVISTAIGATDNLDISASVPFVKVKVDGISWVENRPGNVIAFSEGDVEASGLGDVSVGAKYRLKTFGEGQPDPGGLAFQLLTRLPTGDRENLRGLGIIRVLGNVIVSTGRGKVRPHGNIGFEWWEKGLEVITDFSDTARVGARHQVQYAAGLEFQASPKVTLLADFVGRHVLGGGAVETQNVAVPPIIAADVTSLDLAVATGKSIRKFALAPGLKWNVKGSFVLAGNALISINDNGLRDYFTPVVTLDWTF